MSERTYPSDCESPTDLSARRGGLSPSDRIDRDKNSFNRSIAVAPDEVISQSPFVTPFPDRARDFYDCRLREGEIGRGRGPPGGRGARERAEKWEIFTGPPPRRFRGVV